MKSLADATALRNQVLSCLDIAESLEDPAERAEYLGFVFVGAGYAGVEGLAELQDFAAQAIELYPRCRAQGMRWVLVEAASGSCRRCPQSLSAFAERELRGRGIEVRTGTTLRRGHASAAPTLSDGEPIPARTVVWTAGRQAEPGRRASSGLPLDAGGRIVGAIARLRVGAAMPASCGRSATAPRCPTPRAPGQPCPPTAQHAIRQGRLVARNVVATLGDGRARPFRYRTKGVVAELGDNKAVAITLGVRWRGLPGVVHRPHLPPAADARHGTQAASAGRLERRAAVRPRHLLARAPGQPDAAGTSR